VGFAINVVKPHSYIQFFLSCFIGQISARTFSVPLAITAAVTELPGTMLVTGQVQPSCTDASRAACVLKILSLREVFDYVDPLSDLYTPEIMHSFCCLL
jgi:hypothetical protein